MPISLWSIILAPFTIIAIPVICYLIQFGDQGMSDSQETWAHFGDYLNVWVSLASLIAISILTYVIHLREQSLQHSLKEREDVINRPLLAIQALGVYNLYRIKNIGVGPALDIKTSFIPDDWYRVENSGNYVVPENHPPLGSGHEHEFSEYGASRTMVAVYSDIWGNKISTFLTGDQHEIKIGHDEFACMDEQYQYAERPRDPRHL